MTPYVLAGIFIPLLWESGHPVLAAFLVASLVWDSLALVRQTRRILAGTPWPPTTSSERG